MFAFIIFMFTGLAGYITYEMHTDHPLSYGGLRTFCVACGGAVLGGLAISLTTGFFSVQVEAEGHATGA